MIELTANELGWFVVSMFGLLILAMILGSPE